jgi:hypothetical protein
MGSFDGITTGSSDLHHVGTKTAPHQHLSLPKTLSATRTLIGKLIEDRGQLEAAKQLWS